VERKRIIVAGQTPPPQGGQNLMIAQILGELRRDDSFETVHWPFFFSRDLATMRRVRFGKIAELFRCLWRLIRIRLGGAVDLLLYPAGGPHLVPIVRDICLLPFARLVSRKLVIQFHAAGIAEKMKRPHFLHRILARLMHRADSAIVMTNYNRVDPESVGIPKIDILPIRIRDEFRPDLLQRDPSRILYVGHLCPDKDTPALFEAFGSVLHDYPGLRLELVGEPLVPYDWQSLEIDAERFAVEKSLDLSGVLTGDAKWRAFGRATLFCFPTVAPYESFGLVLAEAMMFGLPIVATDWRGNRDVLGYSHGGLLFSADLPLATHIEEALREALKQRGQWEEWGTRNRQHFERHLRQDVAHSDYAEFVQRWLEEV
jgi:glycosyltransferase involved in cell wall biosynthesis